MKYEPFIDVTLEDGYVQRIPAIYRLCPLCNGCGKVYNSTCDHCKGLRLVLEPDLRNATRIELKAYYTSLVRQYSK